MARNATRAQKPARKSPKTPKAAKPKKPRSTKARTTRARSAPMPASVRPIAFADLFQKVVDGRISEEDFRAYFYVTGPLPGTNLPGLAINTQTVDVRGAEATAAEVGNDLGVKAVSAIRRTALIAAGAPTPDGTIVAEGDSWFNLPEFGWPINVPPTLVDKLALTRPIDNIAHWGDTLAQIVTAGEYRPYLQTGRVKYFLFSAGGNDVLGGGRFATFLRQRQSGDSDPNHAANYITPAFAQNLSAVMMLYGVLLTDVAQRSPTTVTLIHGYDYARPVPMGPWLGAALQSRGFDPTAHSALCRRIVKIMLDAFNDALKGLANGSGGKVRYVKLLNTVNSRWWDELHPNAAAASDLAVKFGAALT